MTAIATKFTATIPADSFRQATSLAAMAMKDKTPKEVLKDLLLEINHGVGRVHGSDSEVGVNAALLGIDCSEPFRVCVSGKTLLGVLQGSTGTVEITYSGSILVVSVGSGVFKLPCRDPEEFPAVPLCDDRDVTTVIPAELLAAATDRTKFAIYEASKTWGITGVLIDTSQGATAFVATDTRRLSVVTALHKGTDDDSPGPILPVKGLSAASKLPASEIKISVGVNDVAFVCELGTVVCRMIEGRFPKYRSVIPDAFTHEVDILGGPFREAVRRAAMFTSEDTRGIDLEFANGNLSLSASSVNVGKGDLTLPVGFDGTFSITLDGVYLSQFLDRVGGEELVRFMFIDSGSIAGFKVGEWFYGVMPLSKDR